MRVGRAGDGARESGRRRRIDATLLQRLFPLSSSIHAHHLDTHARPSLSLSLTRDNSPPPTNQQRRDRNRDPNKEREKHFLLEREKHFLSPAKQTVRPTMAHADPQQGCHLLSIPTDTLEAIMFYLPATSLARLASCARSFRRLPDRVAQDRVELACGAEDASRYRYVCVCA
jgi:hypothetical protein